MAIKRRVRLRGRFGPSPQVVLLVTWGPRIGCGLCSSHFQSLAGHPWPAQALSGGELLQQQQWVQRMSAVGPGLGRLRSLSASWVGWLTSEQWQLGKVWGLALRGAASWALPLQPGSPLRRGKVCLGPCPFSSEQRVTLYLVEMNRNILNIYLVEMNRNILPDHVTSIKKELTLRTLLATTTCPSSPFL